MNFLLAFVLCCQFIFASYLNHNPNELRRAENTVIGDLPYGPIHEIMSHLEPKDQQHFAAVSKEYFRFDPREVVLNLPFRNRRHITPFICDHLKMRKELVINVEEYYKGNYLFHPNSLEMKFLKCLSAVESLRFGEYIDELIVLSKLNFKIHELFPKLKHLQFKIEEEIPLDVIPDNIKSLKLTFWYYGSEDEERMSDLGTKLKEKISQLKQLETLSLEIRDLTEKQSSPLSSMISELNKLPKFKHLSIKYDGYKETLIHILSQTKHSKYMFDFESDFLSEFDISDVIEHLPETTRNINMQFHNLIDTKKICNTLSTLIHLNKLILNPTYFFGEFECLFYSLPSSLIHLNFTGTIETSILSKISLPKNLHSLFLGEISSNLFEALANRVQVLEATVFDPSHLLNIEKPFTRVKTLYFKIPPFIIDPNLWVHLLELLPMDMDLVELTINIDNEEDYIVIEDAILSLEKRIKRITTFIKYDAESFKRDYIFDGFKMVLED